MSKPKGNYVEWADLREDLNVAAEGVSELGLIMMVRHLLMPIPVNDSRDTIPTQRGIGGRKWKALKPSTQRVRKSLRLPGILPDRPINVRTQALYRFLQDAESDEVVAPGYVESSWPKNVSMDGSRLMYAYHTAQAGSKRWGTPPRPVVGMSATSIGVMDAFTRMYLEGLFDKDSPARRLIAARPYGSGK